LKNLANLRKAKCWSQKKLSEEAGVSQTYISELEADKKQPTVFIAQKIAAALEVTLPELLSEKFPERKDSEGGESHSIISNRTKKS
jgi:transcriptional regulator with XRE-family HTH domain